MDCKLSSYNLSSYNLNQNENIFYIFELKVKDIEGNKYTIRRVKQEKFGNLINSSDEIGKLTNIKANIYDINDPTNMITIKKNISTNFNIILQSKNVLLQINNGDNVIINYKFIN
jgi:hypothetical protein